MAIAEPDSDVATEVQTETMADLLERLGDLPPSRVLLRPQPGLATEADVLRLAGAANPRYCELVDGVLVEKAMGFMESQIAGILIHLLNAFVLPDRLGIVAGEAGLLRLLPHQVRIPDVAYFRRDRLPDGKTPRDPMPALAPDLAIEVISPSNTRREMERKRRDYFTAGVRLYWEIDPRTRTAIAWTSVKTAVHLTDTDSLDGGDVLPGFNVSLAELFRQLD